MALHFFAQFPNSEQDLRARFLEVQNLRARCHDSSDSEQDLPAQYPVGECPSELKDFAKFLHKFWAMSPSIKPLVPLPKELMGKLRPKMNKIRLDKPNTMFGLLALGFCDGIGGPSGFQKVMPWSLGLGVKLSKAFGIPFPWER